LANFSRIQNPDAKADHRPANTLGLSGTKWTGGSAHPTVPLRLSTPSTPSSEYTESIGKNG
jgi:hypothetical protein